MNLKNLFKAFSLLLMITPFFSGAVTYSDEWWAQYEDRPPLSETKLFYTCHGNGDRGIWEEGTIAGCVNEVETELKAGSCSFVSDINYGASGIGAVINYDKGAMRTVGTSTWCAVLSYTVHVNFINPVEETSSRCPNPMSPTFTIPRTDSEGQIVACYDPFDIWSHADNQCANDTFLNTPVTQAEGCFNNSGAEGACHYKAENVGGVLTYVVQLESNACLNDPEMTELPVVTNETIPENNECTSFGAGSGMICHEDLNDVCKADFSECQEGCGLINGVSYCISTDTDGDTVPDYLDPDIDGDGIINDDDPDADGDGVDDKMENKDNYLPDELQKVEVDTSNMELALAESHSELLGIRSELDQANGHLSQIKAALTTSSVEIKTAPNTSETNKSLWVSTYPEGLAGVFNNKNAELQTTEFYTFLTQFSGSNMSGGSAPAYQMCFNLGALGNFGCESFVIDTRLFPALKIFILITAGFLCRKILFGG